MKKIVIRGRGKNIIHKICKYIIFYYDILKTDFTHYDIVQLSYPSHTFLPVLLKRRSHTKIVVRLHGGDLLPRRNSRLLGKIFKKVMLFFTKKGITNADMVVVPSNFFYKQILEVATPKDHHIYPSGGLDTTRFFPKKVKRKNIFTLGYVGRLAPGKGVEILLDAVDNLKIDFELVIVGGGKLEQQLKTKAKALNCAEKITFSGKVPNEQLIDYYNSFDIFIFPTQLPESFGNVAIEAMGCKIPIIGSKIGGLREYIVDGKNGYFFHPGDSKDLAKKITLFHSISENQKNDMREKAYNTALSYEKNMLTTRYIQKLNVLKSPNGK